MLRGLISGLIWGALFSGCLLVALSVLSGNPPAPGVEPDSVDVAVPAGSEFNRNRPETTPLIPGTEELGAGETAPTVATGDREDAPVAETASADAPETGNVSIDTMNAPETASDGSIQTSDGENGAEQTAMAPKIATPGSDSETVPQAPEQPSASVSVVEGTTQADPVQPATADAVAESPEVQLPAGNEDSAQTETAEVMDEGEPETSEPEIQVSQSADSETVAVLNTTQTQRLPTIGQSSDAEDATDEDATAESASEGAETGESETASPALGALARNAVAFEPKTDKPLMSIVLIDVGLDGMDRAGLTTFPFPVTFAVNPARGNAGTAAKTFRDAGLEVIAQAPPMPDGTTPEDVGPRIEGLLDFVPTAIGLVDAEQGGFQSNRRMIGSAISTLAEGGYGLLTYDRGLNSAQQMAEAEGLPSAIVFRTLDAEREDAETIKRYLDRAAFKAGQDGHVIMIGHSYPETVTAIFTWQRDPRSAGVELAPLSAILRK